uniref:Uncharacterized protein n=1 Tax=Rhizophora mucronata TaxID=61149 RepID=A0A2P2KGP8_RHIMU
MYDNKKEITDFVASIPSSHCSLTTQSFEKDSVIHMEKRVMEHELPELMVCYEENTCHLIKDICVDDAMPSQGKFLFDTGIDETTAYSLVSLGKDINSGNPKERVDIDMSVPEVGKSPARSEKANLSRPFLYSDKKGLQNGLPPDFGCKFSTVGGEVKDGITDAFKEIFSLRDFLSVPELNKELSDFKSSIESMVEAKEQSLQVHISQLS